MKVFHPLSLLTTAVVCLLFGGFAHPPNDSVLEGEGNHLVPVKETQIDLRREVLTMRLRRGPSGYGTMSVDVHFEFYNPGSAKTLTVGFVTPPKSRNALDRGTSPIENFTVVLNGKSLDHTVQRLGASDFGRGVGDAEDYVHHFEATFTPGLNVVEHSYTYQGLQVSGISQSYLYRLTTGKNWADGTIDDFTLNLDMGNLIFTVTPSFETDTQESQWELVGRGRKGEIVETYNGEPGLRWYTGEDGYLTFQKEDFAPDKNLSVKYKNGYRPDRYGPFPLYQSLSWSKRDGPVAESYNALIFSHDREEKIKALRNFEAEELRVLRNLFFAVRGYDFDDEALQDRYEQFLWYVPDSTNNDAIRLSKDERTWVKRLKELEEKKQEQ